ncbi:glycoside hydrolase family 28 protein [Gaoshiqia sediminis]|uniref:Glycoside hydrolase family 28 protein n=1 Tax=Gaoshiqia sediminis TaxID=2986998 RepID=A0AA42C9R9_9BACT|nr:glycoside hydrolase family 28 protein [Gaoshiqia sediminis]MCW0484381.1 glycoside hydrolase family 28 protein [Gaoshiqia sediminis]
MKTVKFALSLFLISCATLLVSAQQDTQKWEEIYQIIANMKEPSFKDKTYNIVDFGAVADGETLNTEAIQKAIDTCSKTGGGTVLVPKGTFLTGAIHLKNDVNLHVSEGALLKFSTNPKDYLPLVQTRWEGNDCFNYSPLVYANGQNNFAITGKGTLDGQGSNDTWWPWKGQAQYGWKEGMPSQLLETGRPLLDKWEREEAPLFERQAGEGHYLRPQFISFIHCTSVKIEDIKIVNAPFWVVHPILSKDIIFRGVHIESLGPNSDGFDPESCKNVLVENCIFDTGDDCIALKSGRNSDGRKPNIPTENVLIRNCKMLEGHGGVVIGSEISGGARNIFAENCEMSSPHLDRAIRLKTNNHRGGVTDGLYVRNIKVGQVKDAVIRINCSYDPKEGQGNYPPMVRNVYVSNITADMTGKTPAKYGLRLEGIAGENAVENIFISDCDFKGVENISLIRDVKNLNLNNVFINNEKVELY